VVEKRKTVEARRDLRLLVDDISFRFKFEKVEEDAFAYMWDGTCSDPSNDLANKFGQASQKWKMMIGDKSAEVMTIKHYESVICLTPVWLVFNSHASSPEDALLGLVGKSCSCLDSNQQELKMLKSCNVRIDFAVDESHEMPWKRRRFTDVEVTCGNKSFSAHRGTLASRSDVFFTAFGSSFAEARTANYDIKNSSPEAVEAMLYYMYTGHLKVKQEILADLLNLAAQYQLDDLITLVSKHLAAGVDEQNVVNRTKVLKLHQSREPCKIAFDSILKKVMADSSQGLLRALV